MKNIIKSAVCFLLICVFTCGCMFVSVPQNDNSNDISQSVNDIPEYSEEPYTVINGNQPVFSEKDKLSDAFESYSPLDTLGRCGVAFSCITKELMPTKYREGIGQIKPSGWQTVKYDIVDGKYLYNRCHLIGFQLTGENANELNLITGTRYMNVDGMLPFENMVADYVKETSNRVLYRVTPVFEGDNLVASGVQIEALSLEDGGEGICFNVFVYNVQPGVVIDYATGKSYLEEQDQNSTSREAAAEYVLNTNSKKIHKSDCSGAVSIKEENRQNYTGTLSELEKQGYTTCKTCFE